MRQEKGFRNSGEIFFEIHLDCLDFSFDFFGWDDFGFSCDLSRGSSPVRRNSTACIMQIIYLFV